MNHAFNTDVAKLAGVHVSIFITDLFFWTLKNIEDGRNFRDGRYWSYNSVRTFTIRYDYLTDNQVRHTIAKAIEHGLVEKAGFNQNSYDRTSWYSLTDKAWEYFPDLHKALMKSSLYESSKSDKTADSPICDGSQMDLGKIPNGFGKNPKPIPDTLPDADPTTTTTRSIQNTKTDLSSKESESSSCATQEEEEDPVISKEVDERLLSASIGQTNFTTDKLEFLRACKFWMERECRAKDEASQVRILVSILQKGGLERPKGFGSSTEQPTSQAPAFSEELHNYNTYVMTVMGDIRRGLLPVNFTKKTLELWKSAGMPLKEPILSYQTQLS